MTGCCRRASRSSPVNRRTEAPPWRSRHHAARRPARFGMLLASAAREARSAPRRRARRDGRPRSEFGARIQSLPRRGRERDRARTDQQAGTACRRGNIIADLAAVPCRARSTAKWSCSTAGSGSGDVTTVVGIAHDDEVGRCRCSGRLGASCSLRHSETFKVHLSSRRRSPAPAPAHRVAG